MHHTKQYGCCKHSLNLVVLAVDTNIYMSLVLEKRTSIDKSCSQGCAGEELEEEEKNGATPMLMQISYFSGGQVSEKDIPLSVCVQLK